MEKRDLPWYAMGALMEQDDIEIASKVVAECAHSPRGFFRLPEELDFQKAFAEYEQAAFASAVNSAGTGLDIAMWILDIGPGDEVITTPHTFICTATTITMRGAKVVFADIDPVTLNLCPKEAEKKITPKTKAIIPVHFGGVPCDIEGFARLSEKYGVRIVYDAAHSVGSRHKGKAMGGCGDMTVYSFQTNKNMTTLGEGGMITTNDPELNDAVERVKSFGFRYGPDEVVRVGSNYRMTKVQSAAGLLQIGKVDRNNELRNKGMAILNENLAGLDGIICPSVPDGDYSACHLCTYQIDGEKLGISNADFFDLLKNKYTVGISFHYKPVYEWKIYKDAGYDGKDTPHADTLGKRLFQIPVFAHMTEDDYKYIAWAVRQSIDTLKKQK